MMSYQKLSNEGHNTFQLYSFNEQNSTANDFTMNFPNFNQPSYSGNQNEVQRQYYPVIQSSTQNPEIVNAPQNIRDDDGLFKMVNDQYPNPLLYPLNNVSPIYNFESNEVKPATFNLDIRYKTYPKELYKRQKRLKGVSEQRIENGSLEIILNFYDNIIFHLVKSIKVFVKRTNEVPGTHKYIGPVPLEPSFQVLSQCEYSVKVDLDSIYETRDGKKVYELQKTLTNELNLFHLIISVTLKDGRQVIKNTNGILLIGKKAVKRPGNDVDVVQESPASEEIDVISPKKSPWSGNRSAVSHRDEEDILKAHKIVADHIQTKSMEIDGVLVGNKIVTPNGDIAYHLAIDDGDMFNEGEVVGIHHNYPANSQKIIKLTNYNADLVLLKGVITRSQYIEAKKPKDDNIKTETICMMGIVPVRVKGSVKVYDALYASPDMAGVAVSCQNLTESQKQRGGLIGYAFQSLKMMDETETGMVQAGVSVLSSVSEILLNRRLRVIETHWGTELSKVKKSNLRTKKCILYGSVISVLFFSLLGIYLWQLLMPGTAYRYYRCRLGSISGSTVEYRYAGSHNFTFAVVHGVEFEYNKLMEKTNLRYKKSTDPGMRYYLNIDICAYEGKRSSKDTIIGMKKVSGREVFATDADCNNTYYYFEPIKRWFKTRNQKTWIHCTND